MNDRIATEISRDEAADALRYLVEARPFGKVVLSI